MKIAISLLLVMCVASAMSLTLYRRHETGHALQERHGGGKPAWITKAHEKFFKAVHKALKSAWDDVYKNYLDGKTACKKQDFERLHEHHEKHPQIIIKDYENYDVAFEDLKNLMMNDEVVKVVVQDIMDNWEEIRKDVGISKGCNPEEFGKGFGILFDNRQEVKGVFEAAVSQAVTPDRFNKFHNAVVKVIEDFLTHVKTEYMADSGCTKKDIYRTGKILEFYFSIVPDDVYEEVAEEAYKDVQNVEERIAAFRKVAGISTGCSNEDLMGLIKGFIEHGEEAKKYIGEGLGKAVEQYGKMRKRESGYCGDCGTKEETVQRGNKSGYCVSCGGAQDEETILRGVAAAAGHSINDSFFKVRRLFRRLLN